jgi:hypothetical protein
MKLRDMDGAQYSSYEIIDAINETIRELWQVVTLYYQRLTFPVPEPAVLTEMDATGWPEVFDGLIIDYCLVLLMPGDYLAKEQVKDYWRMKVISLAGSMKKEKSLQADCWNFSYQDACEDGDKEGGTGS